MRITGGQWRGRVLPSPVRTGVRPSMERVRKTVFDILQGMLSLEGIVVADLFAGTGSYGIEALSRGAAMCVFVERERRLVQRLRQQLQQLAVPADQVQLLCADVFALLPRWQELGCAVPQLLFADPPYGQRMGERLLELLAQQRWLEDGTLLCLELSVRDRFGSSLGAWQLLRERRFGDTLVQWWQYERKP